MREEPQARAGRVDREEPQARADRVRKDGRGLFITLEGGEGAGKSTQAQNLWHRLITAGYPVTLVHEPGTTALGMSVRRWVLSTQEKSMIPLAELFLFAAARAQLVDEVIRPALERGEIVICDRFLDSSVAYQGYGRGLELSIVQTVNSIAVGGLIPDLTIFLKLPPEEGIKRSGLLMGDDRIAIQSLSFHRRVLEGFQALAGKEPERFLVLDGHLSMEDVRGRIWQRVEALLRDKGIEKVVPGGEP
ncbi:MAG TPA: dTMP kinase [Dehalococcoidia bacterium]|nr:dTMP kinase [Dehalococcoidia bacterium]